MSDVIKIHIDLSTGSVDIEAPASALDDVFIKLETFLPRLSQAHEQKSIPSKEAEIKEEPTAKPTKEKPSKGKGARKSKPQDLEKVELGLDDKQKGELQKFWEEKSPKIQNEKVLTIIYWLTQNTEKKYFSLNETYTALRLVGSPVPASLFGVFINLDLAGLAERKKETCKILPKGENVVIHELPRKPKNKK
ncbi:MAG: hypothetical protein E3J71_10535 [Candidatus Stahlbacteria bacterium]|nr:MAG: hypothetical protein E3J71_10535 [Candidatus Stahlbacteria bacterium]